MEYNLLSEATTLTIFGMGFVFTFLALMILATNTMSLIVGKIQPVVGVIPDLNPDQLNEIDEKTIAIIKEAIKMHIKR